MSRPRFKTYLKEYYKYFNSFDEVVDKEDDDVEEIDSPSREGRDAQKRQRKCDEIEKGDGEEDLNPCKFRQWMEISVAGDS